MRFASATAFSSGWARERRLRLRVAVRGEGEWDVLIEDGAARISRAAGRPDALLSADATTSVTSVVRPTTMVMRRAPNVQQACEEVYGPPAQEPSVVSLRELLGMTAGPVLVALAGIGLIMFGLYGYTEAKWRKT